MEILTHDLRKIVKFTFYLQILGYSAYSEKFNNSIQSGKDNFSQSVWNDYCTWSKESQSFIPEWAKEVIKSYKK